MFISKCVDALHPIYTRSCMELKERLRKKSRSPALSGKVAEKHSIWVKRSKRGPFAKYTRGEFMNLFAEK